MKIMDPQYPSLLQFLLLSPVMEGSHTRTETGGILSTFALLSTWAPTRPVNEMENECQSEVWEVPDLFQYVCILIFQKHCKI